jgi:hypothetical protein
VAAAVIPLSAAGQQQPQQQPAPQAQWNQLPRMQLEGVFGGPLRDTIVQRWRDPQLGTVCYIYLPITAVHSEPLPSGYVQYGANVIGSISCVAGAPPVTAARPKASSTPRAVAPKSDGPPAGR